MRERVLSLGEIRTLAELVPAANLDLRTQAGLWVLLATAARLGELMGAVWADAGADLHALAAAPSAADAKVGVVDLKAGTGHLPTTKNEREHTIHLSAFARRQFEALHSLRECDADGRSLPWVSPAPRAPGQSTSKAWESRSPIANARSTGTSADAARAPTHWHYPAVAGPPTTCAELRAPVCRRPASVAT